MHTNHSSPRFYTKAALIAEGFPDSTIRYYIHKGILPRGLGGRGLNTVYTDLHLRILREIREANDAKRSLRDLRDWSHESFPHAFAEEH